MTRTILSWYDGRIIWTGEAETVKDAIHAAIASRANLTDANLTDANLTGANLTDANLTDANLTGANLTGFKRDLFAVLSEAPAEVEGLLAAVRDGRINGSTYSGACACLVGTIANVRGCAYTDLGALMPDSSRPAEIWFMEIAPGDTPATNLRARMAEQWIAECLARMHATFAPAVSPSA